MFVQDTQSHTNYLSNMMRATFYPCLTPGDRLHLLALVIDRLVQIDAHVDKERLEEEAAEGDHDDCNKRKSQHQVAKANLDSGMQVLVDHVDRLQGEHFTPFRNHQISARKLVSLPLFLKKHREQFTAS